MSFRSPSVGSTFRILVSGFLECFPVLRRILEMGTDPCFMTRTLFLHGLCPISFSDQILILVMAVAKIVLCAFVKLEAL